MPQAVLGLLLASFLVGCAGGERSDDPASSSGALADGVLAEPPEGDAVEPPTPADDPPEPSGPTRESVEDEPEAAPAAPPMQRRVEVMELELAPVEVAEAEDGRGATVPADDPVALDLRSADGFPGRARDPVLHVGSLRFHRYSHPAPDTLRFVVASRSLLPAGARVALQYGDDEASRVVVTESLEVSQ